MTQLTRDAVKRIEALPGVTAAVLTCSLPLEPSFGLPFIIEGRALTTSEDHGGASWRYSSPRFFEVFKIPLVRGRFFTDRNNGAAPGVVLINESMAKQFWPKQNPVEQRLTIGKHVGPEFDEPPREIIGVVADVRDGGLNNEPGAIMYIPAAQVRVGVMRSITASSRSRGLCARKSSRFR